MKKSYPRPISLSRVRITDDLFGSYVNLVSEKIIPYQWDILNDRVPGAEKSHCIENFRIAAGLTQGEHYGPVFCDTDAYKWIEAVAYCIENGTGHRFQHTADDLIELICSAQCEDGYLNTYYSVAAPDRRWQDLSEGHELYSAGHLIEAAVAYFEATGKNKLLLAACRFADLICSVFGPEEYQSKGYPGHQEIEIAMVKLYHVTEKSEYLKISDFFIKQRGVRPNYLMDEMKNKKGNVLFKEFLDYDEEYAQTHQPAIEQTTAEGHAVRALYMYAAMADLAAENGDIKLADTCKKLWDNITRRRMYVTGGVGSSGYLERFTVDYDLPNDRTYCESCASIGLMMFGQRMAALSGDASFYDIVEKALCNTVLAGISITGDRYFYVNPLELWPENCKTSTSMSHVKPVRQPWFSVACCPTNIARTLASLSQYIYSVDDSSIYINQFISSEVATDIGDNHISLLLKSNLMQDGVINISVSSSIGFALKVRMPNYCDKPSIELNGRKYEAKISKGYALINLEQGASYEINLIFDIKPHFVAANHMVRANIGKLALIKGPFVYCLEEVDNGNNLPAVIVNPKAVLEESSALPEMPGCLPTIKYFGKRINSTLVDNNQLYGEAEIITKNVHLTAVPYCQWCNREPGEMIVWQHLERLT